MMGAPLALSGGMFFVFADQNKYWYPLGVLTELLALLIIVMPGFVRSGLGKRGAQLPVTDNGQYVMGGGHPHNPTYSSGPAIHPTYNK